MNSLVDFVYAVFQLVLTLLDMEMTHVGALHAQL